MTTKVKPPAWFWVVAVLLALWGVIGVVGFQIDVAMTPADVAKLPPYNQRLYTGRPAWQIATYGVATWTGLLGSIVLLLRKAWARALYVLSLVAVVAMFGWTFVATDIIAVKGLAVAAGLPVAIALIAVFEIWLAGLARQRGWIA